MTEKVGLIKNPLTIIAIFAGIAEVSGTIVLPFISSEHQGLFVYFLICFPSILVILFFITLNFNNRVLYAPSDYKDEQNYIKINKYDLSTQKNVEIKVLKSDALDPQFISISEKLEFLNSQIVRLESVSRSAAQLPSIEKISGDFKVSKFHNAPQFVSYMEAKGYDFSVYISPIGKTESDDETREDNSYEDHKSIWLGASTPIEIAKDLILHAKMFYPHLEYLSIAAMETEGSPYIFVGGSTDTAERRYRLKSMTEENFQKLNSFNTLPELHKYIKSFRQ